MSKKTLYHSELVKLGIVTARINNEPSESKFPDKPKWVAIELNGEERYYNCENDECELILTGHQNDWVELEARGSREEATIRLEVVEKPKSARAAIDEAKEKIAAIPNQPAEGNPKPTVADEKPRPADEKPKSEQPELPPAKQGEYDQIRGYATHNGRIFAIAWEESKNAMALIPVKDAQELSAAQWLDLRLRITNHYCIEINKIIRKERF